ncbi:MAG TPA: hypothetical protein DCG28_04015 [Lachnospiraceae bacterium]|nr:hypothetical protein [Lachnospiraceae bacterium]
MPPHNVFPLLIYFYITKNLLINKRESACVLPSPSWGGAGGEVVKQNIWECENTVADILLYHKKIIY